MKKPEDEWRPQTRIGRLVKDGKISTIEQLFVHGIKIREPEIVDALLKEKLKEEQIKIFPVQKQCAAGPILRFAACMIIGDNDGHLGIGYKVAKEVQLAVRGAVNKAKMNLVTIRKGYKDSNIGAPHTVAMKVTGKSGSVRVRLIPAPRGTGLVASTVSKKVLTLAGIQDVYTACQGSTKTACNFAKAV